MPTYTVKDPATGRSVRLSSETPLSDADLAAALSPGEAKTTTPREKYEAGERLDPKDHLWSQRAAAAAKGEMAPGDKPIIAPARAAKLALNMERPNDLDEGLLTAIGLIPIMRGGRLVAGSAGVAPAVGEAASLFGAAKLRGESGGEAALDAVSPLALKGVASALLGGTSKGLSRIRELIGKGQDGPVNLKVLDAKLNFIKNAKTPTEKADLLHGDVMAFLEEIDPRAAKIWAAEVAQGAKVGKYTLPRVSPEVSKAATSATTGDAITALTGQSPGSAVLPFALSNVNPLHWLHKVAGAL